MSPRESRVGSPAVPPPSRLRSSRSLHWRKRPAPRSAPNRVASVEGGAPAFCDGKNKPANLAFTLKDMHGKDVRLSDYKGKVILLNFWATWCGPCRYEIPAFVELQTKYKDHGFVVLGVSTDDPRTSFAPSLSSTR